MTFVPPSSFVPATVTIGGVVSVSNFPASQAVTGPLTDAQLAARLPLSVTGPLTNAQLLAAEPLSVSGPLTSAQLVALEPLSISGAVTGPLTDAQLRAAAVPVDGSAVTQPVSVASLPLPTGAATEATLDRVKRAANDLAGEAMLVEEVTA